MRAFFAVAAIVGTVVPWAFFASFVREHGVDLPAFTAGLFANGAAGGFSADLVISSAVFWVAMGVRRRRDTGAPPPWPFIALNLGVGLSCALPAYLYVCHRARRQAPAPGA